jgi:aminopeptidase N
MGLAIFIRLFYLIYQSISSKEVFVKRCLLLSVLSLLILIAGLRGSNVSAQLPKDNSGDLLLTDQNTTPGEFHRMLAEMKQNKLNRLRESGKTSPVKETLAQSHYDAKYYRLDLNLNDTTEIISGSVYIYAEALINGFNVVELNFFDNPEMYVDSIKSNDGSCSFIWNNDIIMVFLNDIYNHEPFDLIVYYHGHPLEGGLQSFDWGYHGSPPLPIMCTLSEPYFAQAWWPCKDLPRDKADSADINITVRSDLYVASNGVLREIVNNGSTKTYKWHESYPITTYLISISATNFSIFSNWYNSLDGDSMIVMYYVYPEKLSQAQALWPITPAMIECYATLFGEYPFLQEKYGMAHFTWGGAMEHQTCTSMSSTWYSEWVIAHELAHQWWGDYITCHNWHDIWLNEGFAVYCEALWAEWEYGKSYYHTYMNGFAYWGGGTIYVEDTTDAWNIFAPIVYDKGGWVHHMLRHVVGDSVYFDIMRTYYNDPRFAHGVAEIEDFQEVCETVSGKDLDYFFDQWIYGTYYPKYKYSSFSEPVGDNQYDVFVHIDQSQATDPTYFTMPIDIHIVTYDMDTTVVVFNDPRHQDFVFRVNWGIAGLELDPDKWILRSSNTAIYGLNIVTTDLPPARLGSAYAETLLTKGGTAPYSWVMSNGNLPDGLELDSETGIISGIPTVVDSFDFIIQVTDDGLNNDKQGFHIMVREFMRGDANNDLMVDAADIVYIITYLYHNGPEPIPYEAGDANSDGEVNSADVVYLINYLFRGGFPPQ